MILPDEPQGWRMLQEMAQAEPDPQKVAAIIEQMNCLLAAHERSTAERITAGHPRRFHPAESEEA